MNKKVSSFQLRWKNTVLFINTLPAYYLFIKWSVDVGTLYRVFSDRAECLEISLKLKKYFQSSVILNLITFTLMIQRVF